MIEGKQPGTHSPASLAERALMQWLATFSELYRQPLTELSAIAYKMALADLSAAEIDAAGQECLREYKFFPTPAEIRAALAIARRRAQDERPPGGNLLEDSKELTPAEREEVLEGFRALKEKLTLPDQMTTTDLEARKELLRRQAREIQEKHQ